MYSLHGDPYSLGLFIPFEAAFKAVKEFIETDGELPTSIEWLATPGPAAGDVSGPGSGAA